MVDPTPQALELLAREVRLVEGDLLGLTVVGGLRHVDVQRVDQWPNEVHHRSQDLGRRDSESPFGLGFLVCRGDVAVVVDVVVARQVVVEGPSQLLFHDRLACGGLDGLALEEVDARLARAWGQGFRDLLLESVNKVGVGLIRHDGQLVDVVDPSTDGCLVHALTTLVNSQAEATADFLTSGDGVVALLQHAHDEHVWVVPPLAQRRVGEDEPHGLIKGEQSFLVFENQVVGVDVRGLALVIASAGDLAVDLVLGLLVDGEVALMDLSDLVAAQVGLVSGGRLVEGQLAKDLVANQRVLLLEHPRVLAERVFSGVVTVLRHLVDEEQGQHLDTLAEEFPFLVQVGTDDLPDLDAALGVLRDVAIGELTGEDNVAIAQLDHVAVRIDVDHDEGPAVGPVGLQPVRQIMKVRALLHPLDLPLDPRLGLDLDLNTGPRRHSLCDLHRFQIQVGGRPGQALHCDAPHGNLLDQLLVVGIQRVQTMDLGVLHLVSRGVPQHHQPIEVRQRVQ